MRHLGLGIVLIVAVLASVTSGASAQDAPIGPPLGLPAELRGVLIVPQQPVAVRPPCAGTADEAVYDALQAADPRADAERRLAAGDYRVRAWTRRHAGSVGGRYDEVGILPKDVARVIAATDSPPDLFYTPPVLEIVALQQRQPPSRRYPGMQCLLRVAVVDVVTSLTQAGLVSDNPACNNAIHEASAAYAEKYNQYLASHCRFPHRDICVFASLSGTPAEGRQLAAQPAIELQPLSPIEDAATAARFGQIERLRALIAAGADLAKPDEPRHERVALGSDARLSRGVRPDPGDAAGRHRCLRRHRRSADVQAG